MTAEKYKYIAYISMIIDHLNKLLLYPITRAFSSLYYSLIIIGSLAFPIFSFLLVESFYKTKNRKMLFVRVFLLAFLSEIPFDLAVYNKIFYPFHQNIYFSLFLMLCYLVSLEKIKDFFEKSKVLYILSHIALIIGFGILTEIFYLDFGIYSILITFILFIFRDIKTNKVNKRKLLTYGLFLFRFYPSFILLQFYNGERGKQNKWINYLFYPVHLLVIYWISQTIFNSL